MLFVFSKILGEGPAPHLPLKKIQIFKFSNFQNFKISKFKISANHMMTVVLFPCS